MSASNSIFSQKEYLKKYLSGEDGKKKKKKKVSSNNLKRSQIIDDDIDMKSMRALDQDEVELYQMDEDAPQIAGIIDDRPAEVKAQEYYNPKRWKVFGGDDGVNVVDSFDNTNSSTKAIQDDNEVKIENSRSKKYKTKYIGFNKTEKSGKPRRTHSSDSDGSIPPKSKRDVSPKVSSKRKVLKKDISSDSDQSPPRPSSRKNYKYDSDPSPPRKESRVKFSKSQSKYDADNSPPRKSTNNKRNKSDSDASPPRRDSRKKSPEGHNKYDSDTSPPRKSKSTKKHYNDSDVSPPRKDSKRKSLTSQDKYNYDNSPPRKSKYDKRDKGYSEGSPPKKDQRKISPRRYDSGSSPPRKDSRRNSPKHHGKYDSDNSPPRRSKNTKRNDNDSDASPPRRDSRRRSPKRHNLDTSPPRKSRKKSYDSDLSPPRKDSRQKPPNRFDKSPSREMNIERTNENKSTRNKEVPSRLSRRDLMDGKVFKTRFSDSDDSPPRKRKSSNSFSDRSPPRSKDGPKKKTLYKPNDSSSDESNSKKNKMKKTLDGKQAGLQDAKQLKKELSDLRMKEDLIFSKMEASVSGVGAAPVKRDRKTGQVRDLEKEKEAQKEKEAKDSVVKEKYHKWGKGLKQMEDAEERMADMMKEMNKPLARYRDDKDLDDFLKAQDREGDPMLDYVKKKQSEATPLAGVKPIYKGSYNPNRFGIRPGHRWDGVVRSNGYEKEWFTHQNARKARDDEAYKWSTSDM